MPTVQAIFALCFLMSLMILPGGTFAAEKPHTNSIGMEFVLIPAGSFRMGIAPASEEGSGAERPQHKVSISKPFYLGKYPVTQAQWAAVMGENPSHFKGRTNPVEQVSWLDAQKFIKRLNAKEGHNRYRLPTEAEWEYAARAGMSSTYFFGDDKSALPGYAWFYGNSGESTHPVGQKQPNPWGLYDVYGNVGEWVQDWYGDTYYADSPDTDPKGPLQGSRRVNRGGYWYDLAEDCRSSRRGSDAPGDLGPDLGFRLALSLE